ncbi:MAG TPA: TonB family protein [Methylophilus sp.]
MSLTWQRSPLFWALWLSVLLHAVLLTLHFQPELKKFKDQIPSLEVMLVNSKSKQAPEKADALAQANLDRGGNTDEKRQLKSPLPSTQQLPSLTKPANTVSLSQSSRASRQDAELQLERQRVAQLEQEAQALMTQLKAEQSVASLQTPLRKQEAQAVSKVNKASPQPADAAQQASLQEMARLEALIAKQQEAYESRPKRQFVGARTREYRFANYVEHWRQKVERVGNLNYPAAAKVQKLYGQLQMTVSIRANGSIEEVRIQQSSGSGVLDEAAKRIVQMAAPFDAFPADIRRDTDVLSITRTWMFTRQDEMVSE